MQVNEHLEWFSQRPLSVHSKGLPANCSKVSQPCFDRTKSGRHCTEMLGPLRFPLPVCFLSPERCRSYMPYCAQPAGNWGVRYNKKGDWEVLSPGLWFIYLLAFKFQTNGVGLQCALRGLILKHRTIHIHQRAVCSTWWRIDNKVAQFS